MTDILTYQHTNIQTEKIKTYEFLTFSSDAWQEEQSNFSLLNMLFCYHFYNSGVVNFYAFALLITSLVEN